MRFIVFEGLDGSGKTSLIKQLSQYLTQKKINFVVTREPGGTVLGDELRKVLLRRDGEPPVPRTELLLYEAIRAQHVEQTIKPALKVGTWVLCDRYVASSLAFQAGGRQIRKESVEWLNNFATDGLKPALTVLLDLSVEKSVERRTTRVKQSGTDHDRFELEKEDFHRKVRQSYKQQADGDPENWLILDAEKSPETLFIELKRDLMERKWLIE